VSPTPVRGATPTPTGGVYQANFANWYAGKDTTGKGEFRYESATREYHLINGNTNQMIYQYAPEQQSYTDCVLDVDVRCHANGSGVLIRLGGTLNPNFLPYDAFMISPLGYWGLWESAGVGNLTSVSPAFWNPSGVIKTGDVVNHLTVICKGTQLTLMINGTVVGNPFKAVRASGIVGVATAAPDTSTASEGYFSNLRVSST
jgi:hypothetical protein